MGELDVRPAAPPALHGAELSREQVELIKRTIAKGATDDELRLFIATANRAGLDPFARQIWCVQRREREGDRWVTKMQTMVAIDGLRLIAQRSGHYAGQRGPFWAGDDGKWLVADGGPMPWLGTEPPAAAMVEVLRDDFLEPLRGIARFESYAQRNRDGQLRSTWKTMPDVMIAKCAEAVALRRAFPQETSGLYVPEELGEEQQQTVEPEEEPTEVLDANRATALHDRCLKLEAAGDQRWAPDAVLEQASRMVGRPINAFADLSPDEADLIEKAMPDEAATP